MSRSQSSGADFPDVFPPPIHPDINEDGDNYHYNDEVLSMIGDGKCWQIAVTILLSLCGLCPDFNNLLAVDSYYSPLYPKAYCKQFPKYANWSREKWMNLSHYNGTDPCRIYDLNYDTLPSNFTPGFQTPTKPCNQTITYFDESSFTVTEKWDMICDREHLVATYEYLYHFGRFLGSGLFGIWSDRRGRCNFLNWCILCQPVCGLLAISSSNYNIFILAQTILGICVGGAFTLSLVYIVEVSGPKTCAKFGTLAFLSICLSSFSLSFFHMAMYQWHYMQIFMTVPLVIFAIWRDIFEESPRWLLVVQRPEEALLAMKLIAHRNKLLISPDLKLTSAPESGTIGEEDDDRNCNILDVRNYPNLRIVIVLLLCLHFGLAMILQVRTLRFTALHLNVHNQTAIMGFLELCSVGCTIYFTPIIGHTKLTCIAMAVYGCLNLFLLIFVHSMISEDYIMYMVLASICYFLVVMSFVSTNVYSCRVLPTIIRGSGFGVANSTGCIGMLFASYVIQRPGKVDVKVFIVFFSLLSFLMVLVAYILPEAIERELPDTLRDAEHFQRRPRPRRWFAEEPEEGGEKESELKVVHLRPSSLRTESETNERSVSFMV